MDQAPQIIMALIILFIAALVFLLIRNLVLWYWKIDTMINNQNKIIYLLFKKLEKDGYEFTQTEIESFKKNNPI